MSDQYNHSNKSTGRTKAISSHPGSDPRGTSDESFSAMRMVDTKEHHEKTIKNMSAQPSHIAEMNIDQNHAYKKQSHAVKPPTIQSFVGNRVDGDMNSNPTVKKPGDGTGYYKADKKG